MFSTVIYKRRESLKCFVFQIEILKNNWKFILLTIQLLFISSLTICHKSLRRRRGLNPGRLRGSQVMNPRSYWVTVRKSVNLNPIELTFITLPSNYDHKVVNSTNHSCQQCPWYKLPKDCSLLLSPTSERRCSKMMINHGFFSRYCINLLRKWILYIKIFVCQGRCYNFKPLTCSMSPSPNCPVCPTPYSSTNAFQSLGNLYEGLCKKRCCTLLC